MSDTTLYKTVTFTQDQTLELELALLARIGQLRERVKYSTDALNEPDISGPAVTTHRRILSDANADLVVAHQALTQLSQGRLFA